MKFQSHISVICCTLTAAALASCSGDSDKQNAAATGTEEAPLVETNMVYSQSVPQTKEYTATLEAFKTNNITTSTPNRIKSILVDIGSKVSRGQRVVILDDVNIEQLRVRLENCRREYDRAVKLLEIGGGTQQSVDQLKTELDATSRQYSNLVENTVLVSPISGVVTARNYDPGDMTGSQPILTIEQMQPVKVLVNISESDFTKVHQGEKVEVKSDVYPDETFTGTVYLIHPSIDPATRTFTVEITIPNTDNRLRPVMFARVLFDFGSAEHVVVPDRSVVKQSGSGNKYVYVLNPADSTVSYNRVTLGRRIADAYELLSGVESGSTVVTAGQSRLADGVKVRVKNVTAPDSIAR